MTSIKAKAITKSFKNNTAINPMDLNLEGNKIIGLIGKNGAGKSTLLHMISGKMIPTAGVVEMDAQAVHSIDAISKIAYAQEVCPFEEGKTVGYTLRLASDFYAHWDEGYCESLLTTFNLNKRAKIKHLSKGMTTVLSIVIVLSSGAKVLLLDEPTEGLDASKRKLLYELLIKAMSDGDKMMLISSHLLSEIELLLEEIILIDEGCLLVHDTIESLKDKVVKLEGRTSELTILLEGKKHHILNTYNDKLMVVLLRDALSEDEYQLCNEKNIRQSSVSVQDSCIYLPMLMGGVSYVS